ncbi:hypothetical protein [Verrucosispora sp. WMMC514]|uniref:hypothetical protein n=1 Tax=Verrucosispora sp. WMMC514 TaxID=3015156 RepID=UPI00248AEF4B|nr:hypothetical protein [Verrucosispora sp. WMMC514]WBB94129.1 hypothetical protein O7597_14870 [Verrucosispora sp. WMMC514]
MITCDEFGYPVITDTGIRCGNHHPGEDARHESVTAVRDCYRRAAEEEAAAEADAAAELAAERALEDRGYWDARAQEDWEAAHGVIPFDVAFREALAHA